MVKKITGFLAIPKENAKKGEIISGVILFSLEQMKIKVTNLNGGSDSYRIVKVIFEESDCKECKNGFLIPRTKEVRVEKTFSVQNFLQLGFKHCTKKGRCIHLPFSLLQKHF